ncbi:MAG TPA: ROK family protein, partial [Chloroflexota bacterium]|nr:ROK family protein [Chloroflexota bacterium]
TALRLAELAAFVLAVDLARHRTRVAITDLNATILYQVSVPTNDALDPQANLHWLEHLLADALAAQGTPRPYLLGIGVGAPGPLHTTTGEILVPTNFGHWHNLPLRSALAARFGVPVRVDNDANACALAQHWLGAGRELRDFVYVAAGSGVGAGVVIDGDLYRGAHDLAGEIGHATVEVSGPLCPCGNAGCLELYTTLRATLARWFGAPQPATLADEISGITALIAAAQAGDDTARAALSLSAQYLGAGVINVINAYDPQVVFIGRELAAAGDLILRPIRAAVERRAFPATRRSVPIEPDLLGEDSPLLGAACLVLRELFVDSDLLNDRILAARNDSVRERGTVQIGSPHRPVASGA